jgi:hypothetical protein
MLHSSQKSTGTIRWIVGRPMELHTWKMKTADGGYGAGYYYGADLEHVAYAMTEEEAISKLNKDVDAYEATAKLYAKSKAV